MPETSVRARSRRILGIQTVLLLLVGASGVLGTTLATGAVADVTSRVNPLLSANASVLQDLTNAETGVRGWVLSGERRALEPYQEGRAELEGHQAQLTALAAGDRELAALVEDQQRAADAWFADYAQLRTNQPTAPTYSPRLFDLGKERFDAIRAANARIVARVERDAVAAQDRADRLMLAVVALIAALTALALVTAVATSRSMLATLVRPLVALEGTVRALSTGNLGARVRPEGVYEVRRLGHAVNELAEGNARAQSMETEVIERLRELDQVRTDFVSNVSHELRTPLTSIQGYVEVLEEELEDRLAPHEVSVLETIDRNVQRLRMLIEDLLHLSRAESRGTTLAALDLREVLEEVVSDVRVTAAKSEVSVVLSAPQEPATVLGDRSQLLRAVLNVIANAVKFSPPAAEVEVGLVTRGGEAVLTVRDHGIGIPEAELDRLGSRFFRGSNAVSGEIAGTGLGLRIVLTILDHHQGRLEISSAEGVGTLATITLPLHAPSPQERKLRVAGR